MRGLETLTLQAVENSSVDPLNAWFNQPDCVVVQYLLLRKKNWLVSRQVQFKSVLFKGQPYFHFLAYVCQGYWELLQLAPMPLCAAITVELCFFGGFVLLLVLPYFCHKMLQVQVVYFLSLSWNQAISMENSIGNQYLNALEGLMLKLKLQNFGQLMRRTDSLEKTDAGKD